MTEINKPSDEARWMKIEMMMAEMQKTLDELNEVVIEQGKQLEKCQRINRYLLENLEKETVKPLGEETPPPHY